MIAVDTNILVYSHRKEMPLHLQSLRVVEQLISDTSSWAIPWPCLHEFIAVVTNPKIFKTPTPLKIAFDVMRCWSQGSNMYELSEGDGYLEILETIAKPTALSGAKIHDARVAAICLHHGILEFWSCDRDFSLFPKLKTRNPLV